ncbi:hypothetical protein RvY_18134-2 [Ramazzottius varieornatus]|uniref:Uncharacterized protein n=1 Tax=Ramazzottius varieornatus TaxID=947166 RepID=A0A1D1WAQ1_RAMVA|nr:hypothetical protein RvY_18134-2 [Ramazzottius varieornatus]
MAAQGTFKELKGLSEEYEALKKQNSRQEELISFYEAIRTYEGKYVELKHALSRAKEQARYQSSDADIPPAHYRPAGRPWPQRPASWQRTWREASPLWHFQP